MLQSANAAAIDESSTEKSQVALTQDDLSNHDDGSMPGSPLADDDDAASDGVTDKSSLDEGDKKEGSGKKRKRRVSFNRLLLLRGLLSEYREIHHHSNANNSLNWVVLPK